MAAEPALVAQRIHAVPQLTAGRADRHLLRSGDSASVSGQELLDGLMAAGTFHL